MVGVQAFNGWLRGAIADEGFPHQCASAAVKEQFMEMLLASEPGSRPFRAVLKKFCREGKVSELILSAVSCVLASDRDRGHPPVLRVSLFANHYHPVPPALPSRPPGHQGVRSTESALKRLRD